MEFIEPEIAKITKLERILTRLGIDHTRFTHSHLVSHLFPLSCDWYGTDTPLTISHLFTCPHLAKLRSIHKL